jgi:hypothetical protein
VPERHGAQRCRATCGISIGDEQQPLGGWIELMARSEEIHPARLGQPLACHRDCDVIVASSSANTVSELWLVTMR